MFNKSTNINKTNNHTSNRWTCDIQVMAQAQKWSRDKPVYGNRRSSSLCTLIAWFSSEICRTRNHKYIQYQIKVITKLPNSEQSYKGKVKTHNYINRQNQRHGILIAHLFSLFLTCSPMVYASLKITPGFT